jgi:hypothetical protein
MEDLEEQLIAWLDRQNYNCSMGEWYKGKSTKAINTDKLAELIPQTIRDNYAPKTIKEQLVSIGQDMEEESGAEDDGSLDLDAIAQIGVSNSIFSVGDKTITLELRGYANVPKSIDSKLMEHVVYAHDSDGSAMCFLKMQHESGCYQYTHIDGAALDLDVEVAMLKSRQFAPIQSWFENQLLEWEMEIVRIWNSNVRSPYNAIQDYVLSNIPVTLISNCAITIVCSEREFGVNGNGDPIMLKIAHGVKWGAKGGNTRLQYSDFVKMNIASYKTTSLVELKQMPKIYGNAGQDAMSVFDIRPYFRGESVPLSPEWEEVG